MIALDMPQNLAKSQTDIIWDDCLKVIRENVPGMTFNTWFAPIKPVDIKNNTLTIQLPSNFFWEWIDEHFSTLLNRALKTSLGDDAKLDYIIVEEAEVDEPRYHNPIISIINSKETAKSDKPEFQSDLNPKYTFDNFIKGEGNQLARAAAGAIADNPGGTSFNPFFIYGGVGLGKTHLIQAAGNAIINKFPNHRVKYISADRFTVNFIDSLQSNKGNEFNNFYRSMDVLIVDDIQFLIGKEKTQDLFFHIFNAFHQVGKQIILSSDKPPKDLKGMDDRLISRFHWGLNADMQPPDLETRMAILYKKANDFGMTVSPDILEYIATNITSNIRELEGCLIKLLANISLSSKEITLSLAKTIVGEISTAKKVNIGIDLITKCVCDYYKIDENKLRDKTRKQEIVLARQIAMYLSKDFTKSSLKTIGLHFGGRDHSTVIHACTSIENSLLTDSNLKDAVNIIKNKIEIASS
jgi:chromosomal replication initiator protein